MQSDEKGKWKDILESKYGTVDGSIHCHRKFQSWWWRDISKACGEGDEVGWYQQALSWKIGYANKARFWEDAWVENVNISTLFPRLHSLSLDQGLKVGEVGEWGELGWQWRHNWRRSMFVWESVLEDDLLRYLAKGALNKEANDCIVWGGEVSGAFLVKSSYACLTNQDSGTKEGIFKML